MKKAILLLIITILIFNSCKEKADKKPIVKTPETKVVEVRQMNIRIISQFKHEGDRLYTQGFEILDGILYESSGLYGKSALKKIDLKTGKVLYSKSLEGFFAEGLTIINGYITLLSYRENKAFTYDLTNFNQKAMSFDYETEGWGLTNNGQQFIMSDGSDRIFFRNPLTFQVERVINVRLRGKPIYYINELEYVDGKIYANVYGAGNILMIDEKTGLVEAEINASAINCANLSASNPEAVLNGIAYNKQSNTFYITGKECPDIYEVKFE